VDLSLLGRKSFGDQLKYADRRGIPLAVLIGENEAAAGTATIKVLATGEQEIVPAAMLSAVLASIRDR
jgi:histidyl-tRNA synthetase